MVLGRPRPAEGTPQPAVCGDWEGTLGSIHILQSVDGVLTAWMNRTISATDQRYGERLSIVSSGPQSVTLEAVMAGGPRYQFNAELSSDGTTLSGGWRPGLVAPSSLHKRHN